MSEEGGVGQFDVHWEEHGCFVRHLGALSLQLEVLCCASTEAGDGRCNPE